MAEREALDLFAYLDLIRRRKSVVLGCFLAAGIASAVITFFFLPTVYRGTVKLMTKAVKESERALPDTISAYTALMQKDTVVNMVVERARQEGISAALSPSALPQMGYVQEIQGVSLFELRVETGDPDVAASLANLWADQFVAEAGSLARELALAQETRKAVEEIIGDEIELARERLTSAQKELNDFCAQHYVREPDTAVLGTPVRTLTLERQRIESLAGEIEQYRMKARALNLLEKSVRSFLAENKAYAQSSEKAGLDDRLFLAGVYAQYASILAETGHRLNLEIPAQLGDLSKSALFLAIERTAVRFARMMTLLEEEQNNLKGELVELKKQLPIGEARLQELNRAVNDAMTTLGAAKGRLAIVQAQLAVPSANPIVILSRAYVPSSPVAPRRVVNISVASVLGLVVGLGIAFLSEYAARSAVRAASG